MPKPGDGQILNALVASLPPTTPLGEAAKAVMQVVDAAWAKTERELARGRKADLILSRWLPSHDPACQRRSPLDSVDYQRVLSGAPVLLTCTCGLDDALAQLRESSPGFVARMEAAGVERTVDSGVSGAAPSVWEEPGVEAALLTAYEFPSMDNLRALVQAVRDEPDPLDGICDAAMDSVRNAPRPAAVTAIRHPDTTRRTLWAYVSDGEPAMTSSTGEGEDWEEFNWLQRAKRAGYELALYATQYPTPQERARLAAEAFPLKKRVLHQDVEVEGIKLRLGDSEGIGLFRDNVGGFIVSRNVLSAALEILDSPYVWTDDTSVEEDPA